MVRRKGRPKKRKGERVRECRYQAERVCWWERGRNFLVGKVGIFIWMYLGGEGEELGGSLAGD